MADANGKTEEDVSKMFLKKKKKLGQNSHCSKIQNCEFEFLRIFRILAPKIFIFVRIQKLLNFDNFWHKNSYSQF